MVLYTASLSLWAYLAYGTEQMYSLALGGCVMYLNLLAVKWIVGKIVDSLGKKKRYPLMSAAKSIVVLGVIGGLVYYRQTMGVYFLLGLSNIFVGVSVATIIYLVKELRGHKTFN